MVRQQRLHRNRCSERDWFTLFVECASPKCPVISFVFVVPFCATRPFTGTIKLPYSLYYSQELCSVNTASDSENNTTHISVFGKN